MTAKQIVTKEQAKHALEHAATVAANCAMELEPVLESKPVPPGVYEVRYEIHLDGRLFASFPQGSLSRFGVPFDDAVFAREFDACVAHWLAKGIQSPRFSMHTCLELTPGATR